MYWWLWTEGPFKVAVEKKFLLFLYRYTIKVRIYLLIIDVGMIELEADCDMQVL